MLEGLHLVDGRVEIDRRGDAADRVDRRRHRPNPPTMLNQPDPEVVAPAHYRVGVLE
jgi:hypothetical protein